MGELEFPVEAFSAFSNSWLRYAAARQHRLPRSAERKASSQQAWDPEFFYISRDEVTLELPRYLAKVENSGVAIGDFEYLIGALPSARKVSDGAATYGEESTDALVAEEASEDEDAEQQEDTGIVETEPPRRLPKSTCSGSVIGSTESFGLSSKSTKAPSLKLRRKTKQKHLTCACLTRHCRRLL